MRFILYIYFPASILYFLIRIFIKTIHSSLVFVLLYLSILHLVSNQCTKMTTEFPSSLFKGGHSTQRPPLFDGSNYNYWKCRMKIYLQSINYELWNIVEAAYTKPSTNTPLGVMIKRRMRTLMPKR